MRFLRRHNQRGDTIVEVLVALAILGSALGIGYAAASSGLRGTQQASEHSQALKLAQAQAELLEINSSNGSLYTGGNVFCYDGTTYTGWSTATPAVAVPPPTANADPLDGSDYPNGCVQGFFHTSVAYSGTSPNDTFTITVRWAAVTGHGNDQVQLNYRVHLSSGNGAIIGGGGITNAASILEESGMRADPACGCANGTAGDGNGSTDGSVFGYWWQGLASGSVTTTTTTQHIYVYAREDFYLTDANMVVQIGALPSQSFTVNNTTPYMPYTYNLGSGLPQGTYTVNISFTNDGCDPTTCSPDRNLYVDRVVFSPT